MYMFLFNFSFEVFISHFTHFDFNILQYKYYLYQVSYSLFRIYYVPIEIGTSGKMDISITPLCCALYEPALVSSHDSVYQILMQC